MKREYILKLSTLLMAQQTQFEFADRNTIGAYIIQKYNDKELFENFIKHSFIGNKGIEDIYSECSENTWRKLATEKNFIEILLQYDLISINDHELKSRKDDSEKKGDKPQDRIKVLLDKARVSITDEITIPLDCLMIENDDSNIQIGTLGNISMVTGIAKSKKTFLVSSITAALVSGKPVLKFISKLPTNSKVFYFDTEQGPAQTQKVFKRILEMAGLPTDRNPDNLSFFRLRPQNKDERIEMIRHCIYNNCENLKVVIIDGIRDLVSNINDPDESSTVTNALMKWSEELGIHILVVLHLNKSDKNPRGHLGSEMSNKAESVLSIESMGDSGVSQIKGMFTRDRNFNPFHIFINEAGQPELTDKLPGPEKDFLSFDQQTYKNLLDTIFVNCADPLSFNDLWKKVKLKAPLIWKLSNAKSKALVHHMEQEGLIFNNSVNGKRKMEYILGK
ncbi:MAG: AAA family ATPase [Bacteroidetes bacterium]|nr:AAA family ATPase [Bacteroidota bacterium]